MYTYVLFWFIFVVREQKYSNLTSWQKISYLEHKNPNRGHAWYHLVQNKDWRQEVISLSRPGARWGQRNNRTETTTSRGVSRGRNFKLYIKPNNTTTSRGWVEEGISNRISNRINTTTSRGWVEEGISNRISNRITLLPFGEWVEEGIPNHISNRISAVGDEVKKIIIKPNISLPREISPKNQTYLHRKRSAQKKSKRISATGDQVKTSKRISATGNQFKIQNVSPPWSFQPPRSQFDLKGIISICHHHKNISLLCSEVNRVFTSPIAPGKAKTGGLLKGRKL